MSTMTCLMGEFVCGSEHVTCTVWLVVHAWSPSETASVTAAVPALVQVKVAFCDEPFVTVPASADHE